MLFIVITALFGQSKPMKNIYKEALIWSKKKLENDLKITKNRGCKKSTPCSRTVDNLLDLSSFVSQEKILVFVSFSMPTHTLKRLSRECHNHKAIMVLRGLKDNSFRTTFALMKESGIDQGFEIHPNLFKRYVIEKVPVFILTRNNEEVARLSGNVSLSYASKKLREQ